MFLKVEVPTKYSKIYDNTYRLVQSLYYKQHQLFSSSQWPYLQFLSPSGCLHIKLLLRFAATTFLDQRE